MFGQTTERHEEMKQMVALDDMVSELWKTICVTVILGILAPISTQ